MSSRDVDRDARRLARLYPETWRRRFGAEFEQLLVDEMRHGWSRRRTGDVVVHALLAHLTVAGLAGRGLARWPESWRAARTLAVATVLFLSIGVGLWSQLAIGWAWAAPSAGHTRIAITLMSAALLGLCGLFGLGLLLIISSTVRQAHRSPGPLLGVVSCGAALWLGCAHFATRWPGATSSGWGARSIVPAGLARIGWAGTLWISAYWTHPGQLLSRPAGTLAWMVVSPLLLAGITLAATAALRGARPSPGSRRALAGLGRAGVAVATLYVAAAAEWILAAAPGPGRMFQAGSVDDVGLVLLVGALLAAARIAGSRRSFVRAAGDA